jgi:hypothetical protein
MTLWKAGFIISERDFKKIQLKQASKKYPGSGCIRISAFKYI